MQQKIEIDTRGEVAGRTWDSLSPFAQGYVAQLLRTLEPTPGQWFYMSSGGVRVGVTFIKFGTSDGKEDRRWSRVHLDQGGKRLTGPQRLELTKKLLARFCDLASETLELIVADCEKFQRPPSDWIIFNRETGADFWKDRQERQLTLRSNLLFPPLTPYRGECGKVYLKEAEGCQHI